MKKKHKLLYVLLVIALCLSLALSVAACNPKPDDDDEDPSTEKLLLTNGDFTEVSTETFPKTPSSWSGAAGSTSGTNATPTDSDSLVSGVIDTTQSVYDKNKKLWDKIGNPGTKGKDNNVLMIYNKASTVYQYTLSNVSVEKNKYYKIGFWVRTVDVSGSGAFLYVRGDAYARFENVNTNGSWQKYTVFVEGSSIKSGTLSLVVGLGQGDMSMSPAKGYAFFDNITMVEQTKEEFAAASDAEASEIKSYSMKLPDSEFENTVPSSSQPYNANAYTGQRSKGTDGTYAPSGSNDVVKGIIDLDRSHSGIGGNDELTAPAGATNRMLYINNKTKTAYGYRSNAMIRFESNAYTRVSVWVRTNIENVQNDPDGNNGTGSGVTLRLTTGAEDDSNDIKITNIDTNGEWREYSFYIESNKLRSRDLYVEFWLGQGGEKDFNLRTKGFAYFDKLSIASVTEEEYNTVKTNAADAAKAFSLTTDPGDMIPVPNGNFTDTLTGWKTLDNPDVASSLSNVQVVNVKDADFETRYGFANPLSPSASFENVLAINNKNLTATTVRYKGNGNDLKNLRALPNTYYRLSMWVKTANIAKDKGVSIELLSYDPEIKDAKDEEDYYVSETSLTSINSLSFDSETDKNNNNYVEVVFYIEGSELENTDFTFQMTLGSGTRYEAASLLAGQAFLSNVTMEKIEPSEYTSATTGSTAAKVSFVSTSSGKITNSGFSQVNIADTLTRYEDEGYDNSTNPAFGADGLLLNAFGAPKSWTATDKTILANMYAGVFNTGSTAQQNLLGISDTATFFSGMTGASDTEKKNVLVLKTKDASDAGYLKVPTAPSVCGCDCESCIEKGYCDGTTCDNSGTDSENGTCTCLHKKFPGFLSKPTGYTSPSFTLTKDKFYVASVWAKADAGTTASITLKASNALDKIITIEGDGQWHKYNFFIETGLSDISTSMVLYLGNSNPDIVDNNVSGTVYFDWASYAEITAEQFADSVENIDTVHQAQHAYTTDSFDNVSTASDENSLGTPGDWTLSSLDSDAPKETDALMAGIFDKNTDDSDLLAKENESFPTNVFDTIFNDATHDRVLVINQRKPTAYSAKNTSSKTLAVDSYYRITMQVFTWGFESGKGATITLKLNNKSYTFGGKDGTPVNTSTYNNGAEVVGEWKTYTFYVKTAPKTSISSVYINFLLGAEGEENWVSGALFVDNVTTDKITEEQFKAGAEVVTDDGTVTGSVTEVKYDQNDTFRIVFTEKDIDAQDPTEEPPATNNLLWLYITSGVIGALIILVVIAFFIKKYYKPKKKNVKKLAPYDAKKNKNKDVTKHKDEFKD